MTETWHQRFHRLKLAKDYAGAVAMLRAPYEHAAAIGSEPERLPGNKSSEPGGGEQRSELNPSPTDELLEALREYRKAQRRMLERWADGDENVRRDLWRDLHACEAAADAAIAKHEPKP